MQFNPSILVSDNPPSNGNGYVQVNPNPQASDRGTYSILVTGWSKPHRFSWDIVPNLVAKGTLYNAEAGVRLLLDTLSNNPQVDRVYLLALTKYDLVSQSFKSAYNLLQGSGISVSVTFDLPINPLPLPNPTTARIVKYTPSSKAEGYYSRYRDNLVSKVLTQGQYYPSRQFTALTNVVVSLDNPPKPEFKPYFTQWVSADPPSDPDISYTYGQKIVPQLARLTEGANDSTQRVITLLDQYRDTPGMPCMSQLSYFDGELTAIYRSHDIGQAWLLNVEALAYCYYTWFPTLDKRRLTVISQNAHVYDWDKPLVMDKFTCDPVGYFYFRVNSEGQYQCYLNDNLVHTCGTKAGLQRYISRNYPNLSTNHTFWIANAIGTL